MSITKKYLTLSIVSAVVSLCLYCSVLFWGLDVFEFEYIHILLSLAQLFMSFSLLFIVFFVLEKIFNIKTKKFKKIFISACSVLLVICIIVVGYNTIIFYDGYTPKNVINNSKEFIQGFFPYHRITDMENIDISVSHIIGTDYITVDSRGTTTDSLDITYHLEYFESYSPFMNFKFYLERGILTPSDLVYTDSFTKTEKIEINGKKVTVFRKENGGDMGVFVKEENRAIYAELDNDYDNPITTQTFVNTLIEQFALMSEAVDEKVFLDIPFSDKFYRRVLKQ